MPNLLAHYGTQGLLSRLALREADLKWILTGCLLPDVPWILQRAVKALLPGLINPYDLRIYVAVQASLMFCLLLAVALAFLTARPGRVFGLLALNSLLHLSVDAVQTKWAAGVHLLAPFSWRPWTWGLFWPESLTTAAITTAGLGFVGWVALRNGWGRDVPLRIRSEGYGSIALFAGLTYLVLPVLFMGSAEEAGTHYVEVLRQRTDRSGRYLELDRAYYADRPGGDVVRTFAGEEIPVRGVDLDRSGPVSLRGRFASPDTVEVASLHRHRSQLRDLASYLGLIVLFLVWWRAVRHERRVSAE